MPGLMELLGGGGGAPGGPPGGDMGGGGPDGMMKVLAGLQKQPPPDGEKQALTDASTKISMALSRIQLRSAKAAKLLSDAVSKIHAAREALDNEGSSPVAAPPDLGMTGGMNPGGGSPGGPMGM